MILSETSGSATVNVSTHNFAKDFGGSSPVDVQLASDAILNTIGSDSTLKFDENASISGTGALIKQGLGTVYLDGANTYSGGTTISAGTLIANHENGSAIIDALGTGLITLNGDGYTPLLDIPRSTVISLREAQQARSVLQQALSFGSMVARVKASLFRAIW